MVQWLARLPGTQEIRGSSPGRGMTDFCTSIFICLYTYIYIYGGIILAEKIRDIVQASADLQLVRIFLSSLITGLSVTRLFSIS